MKLSGRLLILVLLAALPVFAIHVHGLLQSREQRKAAIAGQALGLARLAAARQERFIESARYLLDAAARMPEAGRVPRCGTSPSLLSQAGHNVVGVAGAPEARSISRGNMIQIWRSST